MTKAEHFYQRQFHKYLREYGNPAVNWVMLRNKKISKEEAAEKRAQLDLQIYKMNNRKVAICCDEMHVNQTTDRDPPFEDYPSKIAVMADYKKPFGAPRIVLAGNAIKHCPFCGTIIYAEKYVDEEYVPKPVEPID